MAPGAAFDRGAPAAGQHVGRIGWKGLVSANGGCGVDHAHLAPGGGCPSKGTAHPTPKDVYKLLGVRGPTPKDVYKLLGVSGPTPKDVYKLLGV